MRIRRRIAAWAATGGLMLALGNVGRGVQGSGGGASARAEQTSVPEVVPTTTPDERTAHMEAEQAKLRNTERQKKLVEDTAKLLVLANELKVAVDKSNKDTLSLDVVRKADEIEKLAHSVKEGMRGS
jgi:nitric oxide reductase activation protein